MDNAEAADALRSFLSSHEHLQRVKEDQQLTWQLSCNALAAAQNQLQAGEDHVIDSCLFVAQQLNDVRLRVTVHHMTAFRAFHNGQLDAARAAAQTAIQLAEDTEVKDTVTRGCTATTGNNADEVTRQLLAALMLSIKIALQVRINKLTRCAVCSGACGHRHSDAQLFTECARHTLQSPCR
jgi:hypothetical protein